MASFDLEDGAERALADWQRLQQGAALGIDYAAVAATADPIDDDGEPLDVVML